MFRLKEKQNELLCETEVVKRDCQQKFDLEIHQMELKHKQELHQLRMEGERQRQFIEKKRMEEEFRIQELNRVKVELEIKLMKKTM